MRQNVLFPSWFLSVQLGRQLWSLRDQGKSPQLSPHLSPLQPCVESQQGYGKALWSQREGCVKSCEYCLRNKHFRATGVFLAREPTGMSAVRMWPQEWVCLHFLGTEQNPPGRCMQLQGLPQCFSAHLMIQEPTEISTNLEWSFREWLEVERGRTSGKAQAPSQQFFQPENFIYWSLKKK